jgi:hypothetical protein
MMVLQSGRRLEGSLMGEVGAEQWIWQGTCGSGSMIGGRRMITPNLRRTIPRDRIPGTFALHAEVRSLMKAGKRGSPVGKG